MTSRPPSYRCLRRSLLIGQLNLRDREGNDGLAAPVHLSNERDRRDGVLQAWVRQLRKTGPQHRRPRLVRDEIGPTAAVPLHSLQGHAQHEHGDRTQRASLHATTREFDQVASLRVEGVSISATARVTGHSRNTIARWLERASTAAKRFNQRMLRDWPLWISVRLWSSAQDSAEQSCHPGRAASEGWHGESDEAALLASEDSETLNTSFVERLNLTIRQGSAYLHRRSPCHARGADQLRGHVELLRCYYIFIRPHRALRVRPRDQESSSDPRHVWPMTIGDFGRRCGCIEQRRSVHVAKC